MLDVLKSFDVATSYLKIHWGTGFSGFAVRSSMVSSFAMVALLAIRTGMTSSLLETPHNALVASKETGSFPLRCTLTLNNAHRQLDIINPSMAFMLI